MVHPETSLIMIMILLVWQPIGWISAKERIKKIEKSNTKISNYSVN